LVSTDINREIKIKENENLVLIENDSSHIVNYFFGSMEFYYNDKSLTFQSKYDIDIMNKNDLIYLNKIKDKYFKYDDAIYLVQGIKDANFRDFLYSILNKDDSKKIKYLYWLNLMYGVFI